MSTKQITNWTKLLSQPSYWAKQLKMVEAIPAFNGSVVQWLQCKECHAPIDPSDNYCRGCGGRIIKHDR